MLLHRQRSLGNRRRQHPSHVEWFDCFTFYTLCKSLHDFRCDTQRIFQESLFGCGPILVGGPSSPLARVAQRRSTMHFFSHSRNGVKSVPIPISRCCMHYWIGHGPRRSGGHRRARAVRDALPATARLPFDSLCNCEGRFCRPANGATGPIRLHSTGRHECAGGSMGPVCG